MSASQNRQPLESGERNGESYPGEIQSNIIAISIRRYSGERRCGDVFREGHSDPESVSEEDAHRFYSDDLKEFRPSDGIALYIKPDSVKRIKYSGDGNFSFTIGDEWEFEFEVAEKFDTLIEIFGAAKLLELSGAENLSSEQLTYLVLKAVAEEDREAHSGDFAAQAPETSWHKRFNNLVSKLQQSLSSGTKAPQVPPEERSPTL